MHNYLQHILLFAKRLILLLILYSVSRLFFYILNTGYFGDLGFFELCKLILVGIRFDIAAIIFTNAVFLLYLLPGSYKNSTGVQKSYDILFFIINAVALLSNFIDARFFEFINKRSTSSIFTLLSTNQDVWLMIPQFLKDYWYVALSWIILMAVLWKYMPRLPFKKLTRSKLTPMNLLYQVFCFGVIFGLLLLGARGIGLKPIGIIDAANYTSLKNVPLVLNTPFSILKTIENENLEPKNYLPEDSLSKIYNPQHHYQTKQMKPLNVVILILESFSKEYSGFLSGNEGYTPCLDSILVHSRVYVNAYANGTQSYEAMPAILASIPSLMDRPYSGSNYADNLIESLPGLLRREGYHTSFFHGGNNGTMGFSNFASVAGIEHYIGRNEYNNDADYDGHWGIWDEPFLQYFAGRLNTFKQPFASAIFTLSSHHPYNVPDKYTNMFPEGSLPIHKSVRYADYALARFFQTAAKMPWYKNTVFVLTADHAAQAEGDEYNSTTGMYAIPVAFYCPGDTTLKGIDSTIAQQIDIMPSVLDYLGYAKPFFAFGESLFDTAVSHKAITYVNGIYQLIDSDFVMAFNGQQITSFYSLKQEKEISLNVPDNKELGPVYKDMETFLKAFIQTYNFRIINNNTSIAPVP